jgi:hypothetical protein
MLWARMLIYGPDHIAHFTQNIIKKNWVFFRIENDLIIILWQ